MKTLLPLLALCWLMTLRAHAQITLRLDGTTNVKTTEFFPRLATGTPSSGTFLRGDGVWAPGAGGGSSPDQVVAAMEAARLYPVFVIPMGGGYYDFEVKATLQNFAGNSMVYVFSTAVHQTPGDTTWDAAPKIYFTRAPGDSRSWHLADPSTPLYGQIGSPPGNARINQVVFIPSKLAGSDAWMFKGNTHLVWSYVRINAVGPETDANGFVVFSPIVPVDWRSAQIAP